MKSLILSLFLLTGVYAEDSLIYKFDPIVVKSDLNNSDMDENLPVGDSGRPDWTSRRKFSTTRVYLQKEDFGEVGIEQWVRIKTPRNGKTSYLFIEELEVGLGNRMQLDIYKRFSSNPSDNYTVKQDSTSFELRYALADWGVIPLNPTAYIEYTVTDVAHTKDLLEFKLLLGDDFTERLHWGLNYTYETQLGSGVNELNQKVNGAVSYTLIDNKFSVGAETKYAVTTASGTIIERDISAGPSLQWIPTTNSHVDLTYLHGISDDSAKSEVWFIFGYDFDTGAKKHRVTTTSNN
jgi:hypothetical protein